MAWMSTRSGTLGAVAMMGWLTCVLWLDRAGGGGDLWLQRGLGLMTWGVLLLALGHEQADDETQRLDVVRLDLQGLLELGGRLGEIPQRIVRSPEIAIAVKRIGSQLDALLKGADRLPGLRDRLSARVFLQHRVDSASTHRLPRGPLR